MTAAHGGKTELMLPLCVEVTDMVPQFPKRAACRNSVETLVVGEYRVYDFEILAPICLSYINLRGLIMDKCHQLPSRRGI